WANVCERCLIEDLRVHHSVLRQVVDDHVDELDLICCCGFAREELSERFLCGSSIQSHERPDEQTKTATLFFRPIDVIARSNTGFKHHPFEFGKVRSRERQVQS